MVDFVHQKKLIGSGVGRDAVDLTAFKLLIPNPILNELWTAVVRADSDFTEHDLFMTAPDSAQNNRVLITSIPGELPTWKPGAVSSNNILVLGQTITVYGLTLDGTGLTGGAKNGFKCQNVNLMVGCRMNNLGGTAVTSPGAGEVFMCLYCLAVKCGAGFGNGAGTMNNTYMGCGAVKCTGVGFNGTAGRSHFVQACYALDNSPDLGANISRARFVRISDTSFPAGDDIIRGVDPLTLGFEDYANDDFRLKVTSNLIGKGYPVFQHNIDDVGQNPYPENFSLTVDAFGRVVGLNIAEEMTIGPFQPARGEVLPSTPSLAFVSIP